MRDRERKPVVVIGAGQAGLATGYHLKRRGIEFVILDADARIGDTWRRRWDSLRLFSPARYSSLPGLRFPAPASAFPTKDQMADYLERYAAHFALPVRTGTSATRLSRLANGYLIETERGAIEAEQVVVASGNYRRPRIPLYAAALDPRILQLHSSDYRNPRQLRDGPVLIVGAANSGAEIAMEAVRDHATMLAGPDVGHVPFRVRSLAGRHLLVHLVRALGHHILTLDTPIGKRLRPKVLHAGTPLIGTLPVDLAAAGVKRLPRLTGVRDGMPELEDGRVVEVANVIWSNGYAPGFDWIDLSVFEADGLPRHERGIVPEAPGLYFVGLHFLYSMTSALINGVGRDAGRIVAALAERQTGSRAPMPAAEPRVLAAR